MIEITVELTDGSIVTDVTYAKMTGDTIKAEFAAVRELYGEPWRLALKYVEAPLSTVEFGRRPNADTLA